MPAVRCYHCNKVILGARALQRFCSTECRRKDEKARNPDRVKKRYEQLSGNWESYFKRLLAIENRKTLTIDDLFQVYAQQKGYCALTGQPLTCVMERGVRHWTNASIDRLIAGEGYTKDNIQLVCAAVNSWRGNQPLDQFISWCKLVAKHSEGSNGKGKRL